MEDKNYGPKTEFAQQLHAEKYRGKGEDFRTAMCRVANALSDDEEHYRALREILLEQRFLPGGRIQAAMGSTKNVTPYNCFVSGTIEDSFVDGGGCIMDRAAEAAATMRMGGGIGYDFSTLRPSGDRIAKLHSHSSGPVSFMGIFDAVCKCIASSGHRRGAQMGVLRIDHPDIEEFIHAKQNELSLTGFNISVGVTDEFMACLASGEPFALRYGGQVYRYVDPRDLWDTLMRSTWDWAEPGVLFIDRINNMNNLKYCETIAATNPCGEQPLPPFGACLLGSFNLTKYIVLFPSDNPDVYPDRYEFDWGQFHRDIPVVVRAMDNVVDRAIYPMYEQEKEAKSKRRMGLGITGTANAIEAVGHDYGSPEFAHMLDVVMETLATTAYRASIELAKEKGAFPLFDPDQFVQSSYLEGNVWEDIRTDIYIHGIRNSHLISIAPTGTISMAADNVSSGIEPVFAYSMDRAVQTPDGQINVKLEDYGYAVFGVEGKRANDVSVDEHLRVLAVASSWSDSAVSKTCNVPPNTSWADFKDLYVRAWRAGVKGVTTYTTGGQRAPILKSDDDEPESACYLDPVTGRKECE